MSLTPREAAEQVFEQRAFSDYLEERTEALEKDNPARTPFDEHAPPQATTRTDDAARTLADTPHLTGDPEWDAVELAETDPNRPLLSERMGG